MFVLFLLLFFIFVFIFRWQIIGTFPPFHGSFLLSAKNLGIIVHSSGISYPSMLPRNLHFIRIYIIEIKHSYQ